MCKYFVRRAYVELGLEFVENALGGLVELLAEALHPLFGVHGDALA